MAWALDDTGSPFVHLNSPTWRAEVGLADQCLKKETIEAPVIRCNIRAYDALGIDFVIAERSRHREPAAGSEHV